MAKPTKCPNCGKTGFYLFEEKPNGAKIWKCNSCNHPIKD